MSIRVLHYCPAIDAANAASNLHEAINKYTIHESRILVGQLSYYEPVDIYKDNYNHEEFLELLYNWADIIHVHVFDHLYEFPFGKFVNWKDLFDKGKNFIFHSHGGFGTHWSESVRSPRWWLRYKQLGYKKVLCCSAMEELIYKDSRYIRNVVHLEKHEVNNNREWNKLKVIQTPSAPEYKNTKQFDYECNIYKKHIPFSYEIINGVSHKECLERRSNFHLLYENSWCGYHGLSGLEAMAEGLGVLVYQEDRVVDRLLEESGSDLNPFIRLPNWVEERFNILPLGTIGMEKELRMFVSDMNFTKEYCESRRKWMEKYWKTEDITQQYIQIYEEIL